MLVCMSPAVQNLHLGLHTSYLPKDFQASQNQYPDSATARLPYGRYLPPLSVLHPCTSPSRGVEGDQTDSRSRKGTPRIPCRRPSSGLRGIHRGTSSKLPRGELPAWHRLCDSQYSCRRAQAMTQVTSGDQQRQRALHNTLCDTSRSDLGARLVSHQTNEEYHQDRLESNAGWSRQYLGKFAAVTPQPAAGNPAGRHQVALKSLPDFHQPGFGHDAEWA
ncbi:hypothetical protein R3P38DRAFT_2948442 [Favolaschia claudopus]|uniref:Uncharacterized protein n=1 Tax=Favolaschia claudopus TaxID=2862362 RepID=A0AAW0BLD0_9AGAR